MDRLVTHTVKAYHFRLDSEGDIIVSPEIAARIKQIPTNAGLEIGNPVADPPPITISLNGSAEVHNLERFEA